MTTVWITVVIAETMSRYLYQLPDGDTAPIKVFRPVYTPARVIEPGTRIPQNVSSCVGLEVEVGFGIRMSNSAGVEVG